MLVAAPTWQHRPMTAPEDLVWLRRVRDRVDREYAQPLEGEQLQAADVEIVQEPTQQDWGARDCAVRDPAGNMVRIQEVGSDGTAVLR